MPIDRFHAFADGGAYTKPAESMNRLRFKALWDDQAALKLAALRAWQQFEMRSSLASGVLLGPKAWCINSTPNKNAIQLGESTICRGLLRTERFGDGTIHIGDRVYLGDDTLLSAALGIVIESDTLIGHGVQILDNDSHPMDWQQRQAHWQHLQNGEPLPDPFAIRSAPIHIGANVWIGLSAIILKGVTIGDRAVVAAGSIVTRNVPPDTLVAGNPARIVRAVSSDPLSHFSNRLLALESVARKD